jgi:hypothetical protein
VHSLIRNILGVERRVEALRWGLGRVTNKSITHMDLHKPNNKLISAYLEHFWCMGKHGFTRLITAQTWGKPPPSPL